VENTVKPAPYLADPKMLCPTCGQKMAPWSKDAVRVRCGACFTIVFETADARKKREREEAKAAETTDALARVKDLDRAQAQRRRASERRVRAKSAPKLAV
jgi:ribosomal protein S27AE